MIVGAYFTAIKDYRENIDIIGIHLLKSEVCCVGHIYALTLVFFNDENCINYLNKYLDYYLTKPSLYFDQQFVLEAIFYLDKQNGTNNFPRRLGSWNKLQNERKQIEEQQAIEVAKTLEQLDGSKTFEEYLASFQENAKKKKEKILSTDYFERQIAILSELHKFHR